MERLTYIGTNVIIEARKLSQREVMNMALTEAQRKANDKYIAQNYKQVKLSMPKNEAEKLEKYCSDRGLTKAGFIREAIKEKMERDSN